MSRDSLRRLSAAGLLAVALAVGAQPALAATPVGQFGTFGAHHLIDTSAKPGATCKYRFGYVESIQYETGKLRKIIVRAPKMRAVAGETAQTVGWTFKVQRRVYRPDGRGPWKTAHISDEAQAVTSDSAYAAFSSREVSASVPSLGARYRVTIKMIWHNADGTVQGWVKTRVDKYGVIFANKNYTHSDNNKCEGYRAPA
jgi:hypothetical protein